MRILAVTNLYPHPLYPNRATFNRQQFKALAARHPVRVISPVAWTEEWNARWIRGSRRAGVRRTTCDGITADHPIYWFTPKTLRSFYGHCFRNSIKPSFDRAVREFKPDVVLGSWAFPDGWAAVDLAHRAGLPAVVKVHGSDILTLGRYPGRRERTLDGLRRADGIVAVSNDLAARMTAAGIDPSKIRVIYNGVDTSIFHPGSREAARLRLGIDSGRPILLYAGNLHPVKGVDVLAEACAQLAREGLDFVCYMIGDGRMRPILERMIVSCNLQNRVKLVGSRPHAELADWFRAADLFVLPSRSEGVPNVLLEASACGTPFVASRVGGIPEIMHLGDGTLVPSEDSTALASAMRDRLCPSAHVAAQKHWHFRSHEESAHELAGYLGQIVGEDSFRMPNLMSSQGARDTILHRDGSRLQPYLSWPRQSIKAMAAVALSRRRFMVSGPVDSRSVYLTFDDGPDPVQTPRVLDKLRELQVPATFFLVGKRMRRQSELVRRIAREGHAIGHHIFFHARPHLVTASRLMAEIRRTDAQFMRILGCTSQLFRPPLGKLTVPKMCNLLAARKRIVLWNKDPRDWECRSTAELAHWCDTHSLESGDILLMHDVFPYAVEVLGGIVERARSHGLEFTTIPQ
ncbi:MAG TPA: glycosyltransferase [Tepidisphaeraceae bacterium]|nr:glycosyltransferase [Tepidisphaeraceae bacterium]